eukprot:TRINITY_DN66311_c5_g1_i1.p1 TRINITY_DN66311_c5_g1~~TRINITY_DN66311_c5_g1_i1.p1  ORF type:complete len:297 (-),score=167.92 TRINITY_DN66311_c5_g1_i1:14-904(-)
MNAEEVAAEVASGRPKKLRDPVDEFCLVSMTEDFEEAASFLQRNNELNLDNEQKLRFYAFFKQATVGKCTTSRPGMFSFVERAKWDAWHALGDMSKDQAVVEYIQELDRIAPQWKEEKLAMERGGADGESKTADEQQNNKNKDNKQQDGGLMLSPAISRPVVEDEPDGDEDVTVFDWAATGNVALLEGALDQGTSVNKRDENGLTLLHWAADRGQEAVVELLLSKYKAKVDVADNDGNTPLHCAALSDEVKCVELLVAAGSDVSIKNEDDETPADLAMSDAVTDLLAGRAGSKKSD